MVFVAEAVECRPQWWSIGKFLEGSLWRCSHQVACRCGLFLLRCYSSFPFWLAREVDQWPCRVMWRHMSHCRTSLPKKTVQRVFAQQGLSVISGWISRVISKLIFKLLDLEWGRDYGSWKEGSRGSPGSWAVPIILHSHYTGRNTSVFRNQEVKFLNRGAGGSVLRLKFWSGVGRTWGLMNGPHKPFALVRTCLCVQRESFRALSGSRANPPFSHPLPTG